MTSATDGALPQDTRGVPATGVYVPNIGTVALQGIVNNVDSTGTPYAQQVVQLASGLNLEGYVAINSGLKATYTYAISATAPYATPQDYIVITGSATKTIKIVRIELSGAATAATGVIYTLKKHIVANTSGTATNPTPMKHDSSDGAASATVSLYSVAPTTDATATIWKTVRVDLVVAPAAQAYVTDRYVYDYKAQIDEPLTIRGIAQEFALNLGGAAIPSGAVLDIAVTWTEE